MKLSDANLLEFRLEMEALISDREGMIAENKQREFLGQSVAYPEEVFIRNSSQFKDLLSRLVHFQDS